MKPVAVIILNWNGAGLLREFLPSVIDNTPSDLADVIVADNGSTDDSLRVLADEFPGIKVIEFGDNYGFAGGYNRAIDATRYRYTLLLNSDVMVTPCWLSTLYDWAIAHPDMGAAMPKILSYHNQEYFEYAGAAGGYIDRNGYPYCRGRLFDKVEKDNGQYDTPARVFWATGAAMLVDTEAYIAAGGLDETFFAHMEEIDLCWRLRLLGRRVCVVPESRLFHLGGGSLPPSDPRKTYLNYRNNLLMLHKNLVAEQRTGVLLRRRLLDTLAWGLNVATGKWRAAAAILRAHRDFRRMRSDFAIRTSGITDSDRSKRPNIIVDYFLRGRRRFSDL